MAVKFDSKDGFGVAAAIVGHVLLGAGLVLGLGAAKDVPIKREPMVVELITETAAEATAPKVSNLPPAPAKIDSVADAEEVTAPPAPSPPEPLPRVFRPQPAAQPAVRRPVATPTPAARPVPKAPPAKVAPRTPPKTAPAKATPKAPPAKAAPAKATPRTPIKGAGGTTGRAPTPSKGLQGIVDGLGKAPSPSKVPAAAPATKTAAQIKQSVRASIYAEVRPIFARRAPSGLDIEKLVTVFEVRVNPNGSLASEPRFVSQSGKTPSNAPQQALHIDAAKKAIKASAPFNMSETDFTGVQVIELEFRVR
jgi:periplasmic protein TonB